MTQFSVSLDKIAQQLKLEVEYTPKELKDIPIYTADVNRPGLLLTGYDEYFAPTRIQIYGNAEMGYLSTLQEAERRSRMHTLFATRPPALVVPRNLAVFSEIMEFASQYGVPVLRTAESTSGFMSALISMLNIELAQRITLELKDKVGKGLAAGTGFSGNVAAPAPSSAPAQAVAALVSLGYAPSDAAAAVARVDETLSVQEIITIALRSLSRV